MFQPKSRPLVGISLLLFALFGLSVHAQDDLPKYKMCVPHIIYDACKLLMEEPPSTDAKITCVSARDRMECLDLVNRREADFLAVDPEDMYVAFNLKNEDFAVFSEIRTVEEPDAAFRYEGIILVRKSADIHSLADLKGKKSCHTGYGRNVGFKIPITKLRKHGVFKLPTDPQMSSLEKELSGLTELFSQSCLVGKWSPNEEVQRAMKKRYSNLCALCEDPAKCDYPDKYSGYDGSIRCLVENGGDVAFTKVIFVRRYFGLPIGNNPSKTTAQGNPADYEYLCEDGTRKPVTGPSCTWAQRPWQGYMSHSDSNAQLKRLQNRIHNFYEEGKHSADRVATNQMWVNETNVVVAKTVNAVPGDHLTAAKYKDVIERDGNVNMKIKLCVHNDVELRKCQTMQRAAFSRDIRPEFNCVLHQDCIGAVQKREADAVVLPRADFRSARSNQLTPILFEQLDKHTFYVAIVDPEMDRDTARKAAIKFDESNKMSVGAALFLNYKRGIQTCPANLRSVDEAPIRIVTSKRLVEAEFAGKELMCPDMSRRSFAAASDCNFNENLLGGGVFVSNTLGGIESETMLHAFEDLSKKFGHGSKTESVFEVFGEFEKGKKNVIFGDETGSLASQSNDVDRTDESLYYRLHCIA